MIILFAAGNFGGNGAGSVSLESQAKNVVSVGGSETTLGSNNINNVAFFSSKGPSFDGRIKPEIVSPGASILSANSNAGNGATCQTVSMQGTSMASPAAAGTALLIRQYFMDNNHQFWTKYCKTSYSMCQSFSPSGVLIKAALIHSGTQMAIYDGFANGYSNIQQLGAPPDNTQGYGRINLMNVLPLVNVNKFDLFVDDLHYLPQNNAVTYRVDITDTSQTLK